LKLKYFLLLWRKILQEKRPSLPSAEIIFWVTINTPIVTVIAAIKENVMYSSQGVNYEVLSPPPYKTHTHYCTAKCQKPEIKKI
jgi:hypothetical protein